ncbi:MAG: hypothetical protein ACW98X_13005 [Promethearchaeota archaeon]|jgi:hypothetical protein
MAKKKAEEAPKETKKEAVKKKAAKPAPKKKAAPPAPPKPKRQVFKKVKVNFWRTRLHDEELGIHQQLKYQAKTRYFSKNFDIEGVIEVDGEKKYIIAFNVDDWEEKPIEEKRLICRFFTIMEEGLDGNQKGGNFKAGIELSVTHSLIQSYEIKIPAPVFFMQIPGTISLARVVRGWRLMGTRWTFPLLPEQPGDKLQMVMCKGVVGPGRNYKIYIGDQKIARIDGQRVQKNFELEIYDEAYAKDKSFVKYMTLFACGCNFMHDSEKLVKRLYKKMKKTGTSNYKMPKQELDLFKNPRMMRK